MKASPELLYKILGETFILKVCTLAEVWYNYINILLGPKHLSKVTRKLRENDEEVMGKCPELKVQ